MACSEQSFTKEKFDEQNLVLKKLISELRELREKIIKQRDRLIRITELDKHANIEADEITRFSRQIILPEVGIKGQECLKRSSVLIVGAGGLGCPAGLYLAAAGIGKIGVVDYDRVEISNLHRQVLHTEDTVELPKSVSFCEAIASINSKVVLVPYTLKLDSKNVKEIIENYDIVLDATDNVPTRYLLNDACILHKKPLVSGSALRFEGQLTVYNFEGGPCYRCLYSTPPSANCVTNCSDGGVIGPITGVIGSLQALEVIKLCVGLPPSYSGKMLCCDGQSGQFRVFKLRDKNEQCLACGTAQKMEELINYEMFCNMSVKDKTEKLTILEECERVTCEQYKTIMNSSVPHLLLDVRPAGEMEICSLPNAYNIPFDKLKDEQAIKLLCERLENDPLPISYVVCRRGNNSQKAVRLLQEYFKDINITWLDIIGGLEAWHYEIDPSFPLY